MLDHLRVKAEGVAILVGVFQPQVDELIDFGAKDASVLGRNVCVRIGRLLRSMNACTGNS